MYVCTYVLTPSLCTYVRRSEQDYRALLETKAGLEIELSVVNTRFNSQSQDNDLLQSEVRESLHFLCTVLVGNTEYKMPLLIRTLLPTDF